MVIATKEKGLSGKFADLIASLHYNWLAVWAACWSHWKTTTSSLWSLSLFFASLPIVGVWAWIAIQAPDAGILSYLIIAGALMTVWRSVFYGIVGALRGEMNSRTIEFNMISRTSVLTSLFGRALAMMTFGIPAGIIAVVTMLLVARQAPQIESYPWLIGSIIFILLGLTTIGLALAPLSALMNRYHGGTFSPLIPFISTLCGFVFPVSALPIGLEITARCLPSTWAMDSAMQAMQGSGSPWSIVAGWLICLGISFIFMVLTYFLYKIVEKRLRVTGFV